MLSDAGVESAALDARVLLKLVICSTSTHLIAHPDEQVSISDASCFKKLVNRRALREPIAYLLRRREFFGMDLQVDRNTLIPRPETELLVEVALRRAKGIKRPRILEIGCGSGCVAIALAFYLYEPEIEATEISETALRVAEKNASEHGVSERIRFHLSDLVPQLLQGTQSRFDLIVSNPPYVPTQEIATLEPEVRDWEPVLALDGGPDGLDVIRRIAKAAPARLAAGGALILECGVGQSDEVGTLLCEAGFGKIVKHRDLAGIERVLEVSKG